MPDQRWSLLPGQVGMVLLVVDGNAAGAVHRSLLDRVAELGERLGCRRANGLRELPAAYEGGALRTLLRDLDEIVAFADAARRTGWELDGLAAAPGDESVAVLDEPRGTIRVHPQRGFEFHRDGGVQRVTELPQLPGASSQPVALTKLMVPLVEAAARAGRLDLHEIHQESS